MSRFCYTAPMDIINWLIDFVGVNNGYNDFSTHMYNFWSGFGGNISILALIGALLGVYRHNLKRLDKLRKLESLNPLQGQLEKLIHKVDGSNHSNDHTDPPKSSKP